MSTSCVQKHKSSFAEETGIISVLTEREIQTGTMWPLKRVRETSFDTSKGESPRSLRYQIAPPNRVAYTPILAEGNEATTFIDPVTGESIAGFTDKTGKGCNIPAETIHSGYEEFGRCLVATALETEPICIMDIIQKKAATTIIDAFREKLPVFAKEHFANEILNQVIRLSKHKYSAAPGDPMSTSVSTFPAVPTGGLNIGQIRKMENLMRHYGWDKGADTPMVNGRHVLQVYAGRDSIEFAITQRKLQKGVQVQQSSTTAMDSTFGETEVYEGIQFIENPMPKRGYVVETSSGNWKFVDINPTVHRAGTEGILTEPNPDYHASYVTVGGQVHIVLEVGYIIHPRAMERQAMGSLPTVGGKTFQGKFNFNVEMVPDWAITADPRCNKDKFWLQMRMLHAYAPFAFNPELMTAFLYIAATPQTIYVSPNTGELVTPDLAPVTNSTFNAPRVSDCNDCTDTTILRDAVPPTCDDLYPENGVGVMRWAQLEYTVSEDVTGITVTAERTGGSTGAASVGYATAAGTATAGVEYTTKSGTFNWADGEFGKKSTVITIINSDGDDDGKQFTVVLSSPTGATLGTPSTTTVTITDDDAA